MNYESGTIKTHNGKVTIENPASGNHRTFSVRTQPEDSGFAPGKRVVALLNGPDNNNDYQGFGFVDTAGHVRVWKSKRGGTFDIFARMLEAPERFQEKGANYLFSGRCRRCNRELTVPESIESGIGPVCAGKD